MKWPKLHVDFFPALVVAISDCVRCNRARVAEFRTVSFKVNVPEGKLQLLRAVDRFPYVPCSKIALPRAYVEGSNVPASPVLAVQ